MPIRIEHHEGPAETLDVATYTVRTASGKPTMRCPACGGHFDIITPIDPDGMATVVCPWRPVCSFFDAIRLDAWEPTT